MFSGVSQKSIVHVEILFWWVHAFSFKTCNYMEATAYMSLKRYALVWLNKINCVVYLMWIVYLKLNMQTREQKQSFH